MPHWSVEDGSGVCYDLKCGLTGTQAHTQSVTMLLPVTGPELGVDAGEPVCAAGANLQAVAGPQLE